MSTTTTTPPQKDYLNAVLKGLLGNQKGPEPVHENPELNQLLKKIKEENPLPSEDVLQQLSLEHKVHKRELHALRLNILEQERILKKLKDSRAILRSLETINGLTLQVSDFLKNGVRIDPQTMQWIFENLTIDFDTGSFVMEDDCYINSIRLYNMILTNSRHQEDKDAACLQLALHELRVNNVQKANDFASLIRDEDVKRECDWRFKKHSY